MEDILSREEKLVRAFRALCSRYGYRPYRMSKFEEYDLYADNRGLLPPAGGHYVYGHKRAAHGAQARTSRCR